MVESQIDDSRPGTRCGFIALIGAPNAGKSTLTNHLVGSKVSIVTHKVQTTRARMRGIVLHGASQLVFVDTPGIFSPRRRLDRAMIAAAWGGARDADIVVFLIDVARGLNDEASAILKALPQIKVPVVLALNKIDTLARDQLLHLTKDIVEHAEFERVFMICALNGDGIADLKSWLAHNVPPGPWLYPEDQIADAPMRYVAAEITREKLFLRLHQELPYASTVETTTWKRVKKGAVRIEQTIFVERASQKKIVLGKAGRTIKAISMEAREEISQVIEAPVHLFLFVKVREKWGEDPERYDEMGLDYNDSE